MDKSSETSKERAEAILRYRILIAIENQCKLVRLFNDPAKNQAVFDSIRDLAGLMCGYNEYGFNRAIESIEETDILEIDDGKRL